MVADPDPRSYSYHEAAGILVHLGFTESGGGGGSHRKFRLEVTDSLGVKRGIIIGLVEKGHGSLKPVYIRQMVQTLRDNHLLPDETEAV